MRDEDFDALLGAAAEAVEHYHGRKQDLRTTVLPASPEPMEAAEVRRLRERVRASQSVFAKALNVSASTVQAWEAGNRSPDAGNLKLLRLGEEHPEIVFRGLYHPPAEATVPGVRSSKRRSTRHDERAPT
ncbi:MAG TPA: helix-turn-helix domain-containing protein [Longimicrobium sp.]|nr:helix-turn-helix domain-containing protein [Longimicrobium sp.]